MNKFYFVNRTGARVYARLALDNSVPQRVLLIMTSVAPRTTVHQGAMRCFVPNLQAQHFPELDGVVKQPHLLVPQNHITRAVINRKLDHDKDYIFEISILN